MENIIDIIQKHSLTVRCLPYVVVSYWTYREGDENKKYVHADGSPFEAIRTVVVQDHDLEYFKNLPPTKWKSYTPEQQYENWKKTFPNGKKLLREERKVEHGGWWYVKETKNTDSTVKFNSEYDKFFAPTLEEAINLYLKSI